MTADERLIEQGEAQPGAGPWWKYTTTASALAGQTQVIVPAWDLPRNEAVSKLNF